MAAQMREDDIVTAFGVTDEPHDTTVVTNWRNPYNTTAFGVADAPQITAVAKNGRGPYNATASGVTYEQQHTFGNITASQKQPLTPGFGTFVQRMTAVPQYDQSVQRLSSVESANIDICALSEVRRPGSGNIVERSHTIFWSGSEAKAVGVGFAISKVCGSKHQSSTYKQQTCADTVEER